MDRIHFEVAFEGYASAQTERGLHLLSVHRRNGSDGCIECGLPHPCATRRQAAELIIQFGHWTTPHLHTTAASTDRLAKASLLRRVPVGRPAS